MAAIAAMVAVRGLGEDRRGIADGADIDAADTHGFQHGRTKLELDPLHRDAIGGEQGFQSALLFRRQQDRFALLEADAHQFGRLRLAAGCRDPQWEPQGGGGQSAQ